MRNAIYISKLAYGFTLLLVVAVPVALAQWQINPQVNTGIYAGPGPSSMRYAGQFSGPNTVYNQSSKSADTRLGYASTGVYAPSGVINGGSPVSQAYQTIPAPANYGNVPSVRYSSPPPPAMVNGQAGGGPINSQVNGAINQRPY